MRPLLKLFVLIAMATMLAFSFAPISVYAAEAKDIKPIYNWKFQSYHGPVELKEIIRPWLDKIEIMSQGRIKIRSYASDELVPHEEALTAIKRGTLDMALWGSAFKHLLDTAPFECIPPYMWYNPVEAEVIYHEKGLIDLVREAYGEVGIYYLTNWQDDPMSLITTKPVKTYDDLKGMKISSFPEFVPLYKAAGSTVVDIPLEEFYLSGKTGVVDGVNWGGAQAYYKMGLQEVYRYLLNPPIMYPTQGCIIMNKAVWESLSPDLQSILFTVFRSSSLENMARQYAGFTKYEKFFEVTTLNKQAVAKLRASAIAQWPKLAAKSDRAAKALKIIEDYNKEVEEAHWFR